ncbi:PucR family transcriptional regulator [Streptomyces sp. NPDC086989]|uniref:PucR family transcriptional regulator n=1 Tax=Streptomyces sp. NPDC086989 TaxID=3365764 RepID=UPI00381840CA
MAKPAGADGPTPPTPAVGLGALLADRTLDLRLVAGPERVEVHGVHASEMADPSPYLLGGELLLTAGAGLTVGASGPAGEGHTGRSPAPAGEADAGGPGAGPGDAGSAPEVGDVTAASGSAAGPRGTADAAAHEALAAGIGSGGRDAEEAADAYVRRLVGAGVAALGFGVAPLHAEVPPELVRASARHGLPLLEVPPQTRFTAVARAVWRLMAEARTRELRRVTEAQQALAAAAARPDPVPAVLRRLASSLNGWAAVLTPPLPAADTTAAGPTEPAGGTGSAAGPAGATGAAGAVESAGSAGVSQAAGGARAAEAAGRGGGGVGRVSVSAGPVPGGEAVEALVALAGRVAPGTAATATATAGGVQLSAYALGGGQALGVATAGRAPGDHTIASVAAVLLALLTADRPAGAEAAALARLLLGGSPAAALGGPGPWYAVHARGGTDPQALAAALGTVLLDPHGPAVRLLTDRDPAPQPGWRLGVSAPAGPDALAAADAQARRALERAEAARAPLARHADPGLAGLVGEAEARAHAEALLGPLSPALRDTVRAWLSHHGSWDRSAAALGVHRNTVRQRIARAASLLGRDLDDPDTRMELWFALRRDAGI